MMSTSKYSVTPSANGSNGRTSSGQFAKGNAGGPGNPHAKRVAELRAILLDAVTDEDVKEIVNGLVGRAKAGDTAATKEVLDRVVGRPLQGIAVEALIHGPENEAREAD